MSVRILSVPVGSIVVGRRIRSDLGDLTPLMDSLRTHGQLNPILITDGSQLIAGHRRLESARQLGWNSISAIVVDNVDALQALELEIEENLQRLQLSQEELVAALVRLDGLRRPGWLQRLFRRLASVLGGLFRALGRALRRLLPRRRSS